MFEVSFMMTTQFIEFREGILKRFVSVNNYFTFAPSSVLFIAVENTSNNGGF